MEIETPIRELTAAFLDAQRERIVEELSERLEQLGSTALLPIHRALLDLVTAYVREPSHRRAVADVHRILAGADSRPDIQSVISGQIALWSVLHRILREVEGSQKFMDAIYAVLALTGDSVDGVIGVLVDVAQSGDTSVEFPGWRTRVVVGRTFREFQMLHQVIQDLLDAHDPTQMFQILEEGILGAFHLRSLAIATVNHQEGFVEVVRAYPTFPGARDPIGWRYDLSHPEILCDVARTGRTEVIDGWDPRYHERVVQADGSVVFRQRPRNYNAGQASFFVPILARGRTIGMVCTGSTQASRQIVLREIERMRPFLHQVGTTLSNASEIIERRRAEEALRESEERYRRIVEAVTDYVYTVRVEDGRSVETRHGPGCVAVTGYTSEAFFADPYLWIQMVVEEDREAVKGQAHRILTGQDAPPVEHRIIRKDGAIRWVRNTPVLHIDSQGKLLSYDGLIQDITERKQAEEALKQTVERLNALVDVARTITSTLDLGALLNHLLHRLLDVIPAADVGVIYLYDLETKTLIPEACLGFDGEVFRQIRLLPGESISGKVFQTGRSIMLRTREETDQLRGDLRPENRRLFSLARREIHIQSNLCAPLRAPTGEVIGTLTLDSTHTAFTEDDLSLLEGVAAEAVIAIQNARLFEQVRVGRERMQALSRRLLEAQETERRRIARELHDEVGQVLTGLKLTLKVSARAPADAVKVRLDEAQALVNGLIAQVRELSLDLRPGMLDDLGLLPALLWHFERYTAQTSIRVTFHHTDLEGRRFAPEVETCAYRIVQEGLTNVARHAGVSEATVRLWTDPGALRVQVEDCGAGFDPDAVRAGASSGLSGMYERAVLLGGQLVVESTPGTGTLLVAELPMGTPVERRKKER